MSVFWSFLKQPWSGWMAFLILLFLYFGHPRTVTITKTETKTETKVVTQWKTHLEAAEGAVTKQDAEGNITITGPVKLTTEGSAATEAKTETKTSTVKKPGEHEWSLAGGVLDTSPYVPPMPAYYVEAEKHVIGPFWLGALVVLRPGLPDLGVGVRMEF